MKKLFSIILFSLIMVLFSMGSIFANGDQKSNANLNMMDSKGNIIKHEDYVKDIDKELKIDQYVAPVDTTDVKIPEIKIKKPDFQTEYEYHLDEKFNVVNKIEKTIDISDVNLSEVIGDDQRTLVGDHTVSPHLQIAYIQSDFRDGTYSCTGTVIGKNTILTNAHCVLHSKEQMGASDIRVYPAVEDGVATKGEYIGEDYFVTSHWVNTGSPTEDFAVIQVSPESNVGLEIGNVVGSLPISTVMDIKKDLIGIHGYPGDLIKKTFSQWGAFGHVTQEDDDLAFYSIDTYKGQSGSSMIRLNSIVGVHNASYKFSNGTKLNGGPKMTSRVVEFIRGALSQ